MRAHFRGLLGGGMVLTVSSALVVVVATLVLTPTERGVMVVAATVPAVVSLIATLGIGPALRELRPKSTRSGSATLTSSYSLLTVGTITLSFVGSAASYALSSVWIPGLRDRPGLLLAASITGASLVATAQLTEAWYSAGAFTKGSVWAGAVASAGLASVLLWQPQSATAFLVAQAAGAATAIAVQVPVLARAGLVDWPRFDPETVRALVWRGVPALGFTVGAALALRIDRIVLGAAEAPSVVAVYALASTVGEVARLAPVALGQIALHAAARGATTTELSRLVRLGILSVAAAAAIVIPVTYVFVPRVFGSAYGGAPKLVVIILGAELFFSAYVVTNLALIGRGRQKAAGAIGLVGAATCVPAYLAGAHLAGAVGCAVASVGVYALLMALSRRRLALQPVHA